MVDVSTNGGTSWTTVYNTGAVASVGAAANFATTNVNLNTYLNATNLKVRFRYRSTWGFYWAVDSVMLVGGTPPTGANWTPVTSLYKNAALTIPMTAVDTNTTVYASPNATTTYTAISNQQGCLSGVSLPDTVKVNASPNATLTPAASLAICNGNTQTFSVPTGTNQTYQWKDGGLTIPGATSNTYTTGSGGAYSVTITNTQTGCNRTSVIDTLTINPLPVATATAGGPTTFCNGGNVVLSANTGTGLAYQWKNGGVNIAGATAATYSATATGSYTVTVTNTATSCPNTSNAIAVTVNTTPTTITPASTTTFCVGGSVVLNAPTGGTYTYQWSNGTSNLSTASSYTATTSGSYTVTVTNTTTNCTATSAATVVTVGPAPSSGITPANAAAVCQGSSLSLTTNQSPGLTYQWYYNGGAIAGATASTFSATTAGSYAVSVSSGPGCSSTTATPTVVSVNQLPPASAVATTSTTVCQGNSVSLSANTGTNLSYQWKLNGAPVSTGGTAATYAAPTSGSYTVTVTNTATGCPNTSNAIPVTVNPQPVATIAPAGATTFCQGGTVVMNANTGTGLGYEWKLNGATIGGATTNTYTAATAGNYTVTVTNTSTNCQATSAAQAIVVNPLPVATTTPTGSVNLCTGSSVTLTGPATISGYTYQWKLNGVNVATGGTANNYTANAAGAYTLTVNNTNTGCINTSPAANITLVPLPTAVVAPVTSATGCDSVLLTAATSTGTGLTYQWKLGGASIAGATNATYAAVATGNYTVTVTNNNACVATSTPVAVTVNPSPQSVITYATPLVFCQGGAVVLNAYIGTGLRYQWYLNALPLTNDTLYNKIASMGGTYTVKVTNSFNCSKFSPTELVQVNALPTPVITHAGNVMGVAGTYATYQWYYNMQPIPGATAPTYTGTQNGAYSVAVVNGSGCTGISEVYFINTLGVSHTAQAAGIKVYPNPTSGIVHIDASVKTNLSLRDITGKVILSENDAKDVNLDRFADGMYLLYITNNKNGELLRVEKLTKRGF